MSIPVYIVDDDDAARQRLEYLFSEFMEGELQLVGQSGQPAEAIGSILSLEPEMIFLDVEMPGMSGLEMARILKQKAYRGKIVFVSAHGHYSIRAIKASAFDYILKPVDVDELKDTISRYRDNIHHDINPEHAKAYELSSREMEMVRLLAKGLSSEEIAKKMFLSRHTIDTHRRNILNKTGARNTIELLNMIRN